MSYAIEAKHVGGREPLEVIIERYQPQAQYIMWITGTKRIAMSVIMGTNEPIVEFIERDDAYIQVLKQRGRQLMDCVEARRPPVVLPPVPPPIDASKIYDMTGRNEWASAAVTWLTTKAAARDCADAEKYLKALVPEDAKKVTGYGVMILRDRARRLSVKEIVQ